MDIYLMAQKIVDAGDEAEAIGIVNAILEAAADAAAAAVNSCRHDGESDLRTARHRAEHAIRDMKGVS